MNNPPAPRIEALDWLRGLMAMSVMFYHLISDISLLNTSSPLRRLGIYAVSIFFILSGLCMAMVYNNYIKGAATSLKFLVRRLFRIAPLLWMAIALTFLAGFAVHAPGYDLPRILLNFTLLFGFTHIGSYIVAGSWSIGNELVYYVLTPLIILLFNFKKSFGNLLFLITLAIGLFFSFNVLNPNLDFDLQWIKYINPFNNLFLYVAGVAMYYNLKDFNINKKANLILLSAAVILFSFLPFRGNVISIVTGPGRVIFATLSFVIVFCFYKMDINLPPVLRNPLTIFGVVSYGIYLYHPAVGFYMGYLIKKTGISGFAPTPILLLFLVPIATFLVSKYSYEYFELKFIKIGKKITAGKRFFPMQSMVKINNE